MGMLLFPHIFLLAVAATIAPSLSWGKDGHFMTCKIAEQYLTEEAATAVSVLLPAEAEGELASVCSWADSLRFTSCRWASPLHFINTPDVCNYKYSRDCYKTHNPREVAGMCVAGAINNYTAQLQTYGDRSSSWNLTESLMFLAHFVGDIHQPLHVAFDSDYGGNSIKLRWFRRKSNLHHVWDVEMIEDATKRFYGRDPNNMLQAIQMNITSNEIDDWTCTVKSATCTDSYATESIGLACEYAYKDVEQDMTLGDDYFLSRLPIMEERIAQGGVRLASILNGVFGSGSSLDSDSGSHEDS